jgi:plastocyanin
MYGNWQPDQFDLNKEKKMLRTLTTKVMQSKKLVSTSARTIMTFADAQVEQSVMQMAKAKPELMEKVEMLKASPQTYHVREGAGKFDPRKLEVEVRPKVHHQHAESIPHELFHAAHFESIRAAHKWDAEAIFELDDHRPIIEKAALIFGKRMTGPLKKEDVEAHFQQYVDSGLLQAWSDTKHKPLLSKPYHKMAQKEFDEL